MTDQARDNLEAMLTYLMNPVVRHGLLLLAPQSAQARTLLKVAIALDVVMGERLSPTPATPEANRYYPAETETRPQADKDAP